MSSTCTSEWFIDTSTGIVLQHTDSGSGSREVGTSPAGGGDKAGPPPPDPHPWQGALCRRAPPPPPHSPTPGRPDTRIHLMYASGGRGGSRGTLRTPTETRGRGDVPAPHTVTPAGNQLSFLINVITEPHYSSTCCVMMSQKHGYVKTNGGVTDGRGQWPVEVVGDFGGDR